MPDHIVGAQSHKPSEQQVVVELLQQPPLGADLVERLQQRGQQQLFQRDRGTALFWLPFLWLHAKVCIGKQLLNEKKN
jgi:hypothetical protein